MNCPGCNAPIGRFDLAPNCKKCGVHILYYTQENDLARDAKKTELEFASARAFVAKLKAAFIGTKLQIIRMVFLLLSVAGFLLPHFNVNFSFPWWEYELSAGALGIYNIISSSFYEIFFALGKTGAGQQLHTLVTATFILFIAAVLFVAVCLILWILSFINIKKTSLISGITGALAICCQLTGTVLSFIAVTLSGGFEHITVKPLYGGILSALLIGVFTVLSIMLYLNPPSFSIKEADKKRLEIKEKLKKGEITLDELPLPIVEEAPSEKEEKKKTKKKRGKKK